MINSKWNQDNLPDMITIRMTVQKIIPKMKLKFPKVLKMYIAST